MPTVTLPLTLTRYANAVGHTTTATVTVAESQAALARAILAGVEASNREAWRYVEPWLRAQEWTAQRVARLIEGELL